MSTTSHVTINSDIEDDTVTDKICEYPPHVEGRVSIHIADLKSLEENEYLNDQIISKCFRFIVIFLQSSAPVGRPGKTKQVYTI